MNRALLPALLTAFLLAAQSPAQTVTVPNKVTIDTPGIVVVRATSLDCDDCRWWCMGPGIQTFPPDVVAPKLGVFVGLALKEGTYRIGVVGAKTVNGKAVIGEPSYCTVVVGSPGPEPGPNPPVPPPPPPAPIPVAGFRVLIVYESGQTQTLTQRQIMYGALVRDYLNKTCVKAADGKTPEWWILDKDATTTNLPKHWQDAMKRPRGQVPWIIISDGKTGFEGPLPDTLEKTMTLLQKYGGQ